MNRGVPAVVFHAFERKTEFEHSKSKAIYENLSLVTCCRPHNKQAAESKAGHKA